MCPSSQIERFPAQIGQNLINQSIINKSLFKHGKIHLAPVVQRLDNFIQWISHYPTVSICAKIIVFPRAQANMYTLTRAQLGSTKTLDNI